MSREERKRLHDIIDAVLARELDKTARLLLVMLSEWIDAQHFIDDHSP